MTTTASINGLLHGNERLGLLFRGGIARLESSTASTFMAVNNVLVVAVVLSLKELLATTT